MSTQVITSKADIYAEILKRKQELQTNTSPPREVSSRETMDFNAISPREVTSRSREELNNATIKQQNNSSRLSGEDEIDSKSLLSQKQDSVVLTDPREVSSRYSGIIIQHCKTERGIKLAITLQNELWAETGHKLLVTAELKRYDRLREIKQRSEDSSEFNDFLEDTKRHILELKDHRCCLGRLHARGKRASWVIDTLVMAYIEDNRVTEVILWLEGEEFVVQLDGELSPAQIDLYHATGKFGNIKNLTGIAPKLSQLPLTKCWE